MPVSAASQSRRHQGSIFKKIDYEVERELTEQELTDNDILRGFTPKSQWQDVNVNVR